MTSPPERQAKVRILEIDQPELWIEPADLIEGGASEQEARPRKFDIPDEAVLRPIRVVPVAIDDRRAGAGEEGAGKLQRAVGIKKPRGNSRDGLIGFESCEQRLQPARMDEGVAVEEEEVSTYRVTRAQV